MIQIKNYKQISFLSTFSNILIVITVVVINLDAIFISLTYGLKNEEEVNLWSNTGLFIFTVKYMNSLEGVAVVPGLYASAKRKSTVDKTFRRIYQTHYCVSLSMACLAYFAHRGGTRQIAIMNLRYGMLSHFL